MTIDAEILQRLSDAIDSGEWLVTIHSLKIGTIRHFFKPSRRFPASDFRRCADKLREDGYNRLRFARKTKKREERKQ